MKRRKPILEFQNSRESSFHASRNTPGISSLVCYSENSDTESSANTSRANSSHQDADLSQIGKPTTPWQACVDKNTGYSYYWNVETNQVTWNPPEDYLAYQAQVEEWETQQAANSAKFEELSEIQQKTGKPIFAASEHNSASDSDSDVKEDKIELISAYGPASDDESDSERKDTSRTFNRGIECYENKFISSNKPNQSSYNNQFSAPVTSSIIPDRSNINYAGVKNNSPTCSTPSENISNNKLVKQEGTALKNNVYPWSLPEVPESSSKPTESNSKLNKILDTSQYDPSDDDDEDEDDEGLDDLIIGRLRKKAMLLKQLGGEVPQEILSVFDHTKTAEDIIAEIEKEIPVDSLGANVEFNNEVKPFETSEGDKSNETPPPKPLFPILDYVKKEEPQVEFKVPLKCFPSQKNKMKIVQKIKLSARAKELIRTSLLTAKARATNFVETADGLKPAEEVKKLEELHNLQSQASETNNKNDIIADDPEDTLLVKNGFQETDERSSASSVIEDLESKKSPPTANYFNLNEEKKTVGLGTKTEEIITKRSDLKVVKSEPLNDGKYDFQTSFMIYNSKQKKDDVKKPDDIKNASLWSKCEEFLKSELNRPEIKETDKDASKKDDDKSKRKSKNDTVHQKFNDIDIDEVLDTKNENEDKKMSDLSQLIMEKLKFLSAGKNPVSSVQVMTIQIETLVGAWQNGALTLKYLSDWLDASLVQLKSFEEAAAPKGWHCEWDRSYGRYYYRNKVTGSIQWDYPDYDDKTESSSRSSRRSSRRSNHSRPRTPPPPVISDMVPPPPPVISDRERELRRRRPSPRRDSDRRRRDDSLSPRRDSDRRRRDDSLSPRRDSDRRRRDDSRSRYSSYSSKSRYKRDRSRSRSPVLPPLPPNPPKPATPPPPPPPSSPPPLPPPPPVTVAGTETNLENYSDKCTTVTPMEIENDDEKPIKMHDELDSFYSDIASIEASFNQTNTTEQPVKLDEPLPPVPKPQPEYIFFQDDSVKVEEKVVKKKKKVKLDSGLSLKKKGLETLVAKWQKVNSDM